MLGKREFVGEFVREFFFELYDEMVVVGGAFYLGGLCIGVVVFE